jgi:hypothetical protein
MQVIILDEHFVAFETLYSEESSVRALQETLCRKSVSHGNGELQRIFYIQPLSLEATKFEMNVYELPRSQLFLNQEEMDTVGARPHFFYALLDDFWKENANAPLSISVLSDDDLKQAFELQVSWDGCPDINLRDERHQVLTFDTRGRMLILPSQFGDPRPEVVYVGVRPRPGTVALLNVTQSNAVRKNLTLTVSFAESFSSSVAVVQWALMLTFLILFLGLAVAVSTLVLRPGVRRLKVGMNDEDEEEDRRLGDRRSRSRAKSYLWMIVLGGLFYLLPSLQTAGAEASSMLTTGNRDVCYYNEDCMFPLQTFGPYGVVWWAGNNVISNTGYILIAILIFSWTMWCKRNWGDKELVLKVVSLPHDYTLFYCLAVTLFYEGLMSATYHICPTRLIFTIDTAFMFVGSVLISLEVYRKWFRHLPHPMFPFSLLAVLMIFNYFGTFLDIYKVDSPPGTTDTANEVLWAVLFILIWCTVIIVVSVRHRMRIPVKVLILMTSVNCLFGFLPICSFFDFAFSDRSSLLLGVALCSALFNLFAYVLGTMKRVGWPIRLFRLFLGLIILSTAIPAMWFFANSPSNKALSPWISREVNAPCASSGFYDDHDLWHMLSAVALGLTIITLMHAGEESGNGVYSQVIFEKKNTNSDITEQTPLI